MSTWVRSLPRRNENKIIKFKALWSVRWRPKPTSKEWKRVSIAYLEGEEPRSEAYLEGMKTWGRGTVQSQSRRGPKPTSKEWKLSKSLLYILSIISVRSLPRRNENRFRRLRLVRFLRWSEAYLEGMKTRKIGSCKSFSAICPKPTSKEWKL